MNKQKFSDTLTDRIIKCIITVHRTLGPGFLESVYRRAMMIELGKANLRAETESKVVIRYDGQEVGVHRLDILIEGQVIVELKTVECLSPSHYSQVRSYLKATGLKRALLVNFSKSTSAFRRVEAPKEFSPPLQLPTSPALTPSATSRACHGPADKPSKSLSRRAQK